VIHSFGYERKFFCFMSDSCSDEKLFTSRMKDLGCSAEKGKICFSDFLTPAERSWLLCMKELQSMCRIDFIGGYDDAERVRAKFYPIDFDYETEDPIKYVKIRCRMGELTHRDVLGSVLGLGISRGKIGDILITDNECIVICESGIADYIVGNLERVGRLGVKVESCDEIVFQKAEPKKLSVSVASMRLDIIVSDGFNISRTQAAEMIRDGLCFVNWVQKESPSYTVKVGDVITLRGKGRITLAGIGGQSRKGKTFIEINI